MDRDPAEARFCAECKRCHSAEEGDLWAESSMLGLRITYFACMDGKVYDITGGYQIVVSFACVVIYPLPKLFQSFSFPPVQSRDLLSFCGVSEWAGCQRIGISPDTHRVPYHISFGSKNSNPPRHR